MKWKSSYFLTSLLSIGVDTDPQTFWKQCIKGSDGSKHRCRGSPEEEHLLTLDKDLEKGQGGLTEETDTSVQWESSLLLVQL